MSKRKRFFSSLLNGLKNLVTKNIGIKIVALVFAIALWGYVMAEVNPVQPKIVTNVPISVEGTTDLMNNRHLIIVEETRGTADVTVASNINNHSKLNSSRVNCSVSVATITAAGTYSLPIDASVQNDLGTVASVSPSSINIVVDELITKTVPVSLNLIGELDEGYEITSQSAANSIIIEGAARYIEPITRAEVRVPIEGMTENFDGAVNVTFFDAEGNEQNIVTRAGDTPNVVVQLGVMAVKRSVPIELILSDYDDKYIAVNTSISFDTIDLLGEPEVLEGITKIETEEIPITESMIDTSVTNTYALILPEGVTVRTGQQKSVRVTIEVSDAEAEMDFVVNVAYTNLARGLELSNDTPSTITIRVKGKVKDLEKAQATDFAATVDLNGRGAGTYIDVLATTVYKGRLDLILLKDSVKVTVTLVTAK